MNEQQSSQQNQLARVIAKAWADDDFKARLIANPTAVLTAEGLSLRAGATIKIVENSPTLTHIVLPCVPSDRGMEELGTRVAAFSGITCD